MCRQARTEYGAVFGIIMFYWKKILVITFFTGIICAGIAVCAGDFSSGLPSGFLNLILEHTLLAMIIFFGSILYGCLHFHLYIDRGYAGKWETFTERLELSPGLPGADFSRGDLTLAMDRRHLVHKDGSPFFFMADTAWQLFHKLTREETISYLENRRARGFTVILASVMPDYYPLDGPNRYGVTTLINNDPERPNLNPSNITIKGIGYSFWDHVDWVIDQARDRGMYIGLLPTWGDKVTKMVGLGPEIFTPVKAATYGTWIGKRYAHKDNIIWIIGGDRGAGKAEHRNIWNAMARAIKAADSRHLMTYHPWTYQAFWFYPAWGGGSSSTWFHGEDWLDFNMIQSGHFSYNRPNYRVIGRDFRLEPVKPTLDGEPNYEDHALQQHIVTPYFARWFNELDVRKGMYWSLLAGACGHTYGHHAIWQFAMTGVPSTGIPRRPLCIWKEAINYPGSLQCGLARRLFESRQWQKLTPRQDFIKSGEKRGRRHVQAAVASDGSFVFVYIPESRERVTLATSLLMGGHFSAAWFNPRNGESTNIGVFEKTAVWKIRSPETGPDWVLVLDARCDMPMNRSYLSIEGSVSVSKEP